MAAQLGQQMLAENDELRSKCEELENKNRSVTQVFLMWYFDIHVYQCDGNAHILISESSWKCCRICSCMLLLMHDVFNLDTIFFLF